ncbi:sushi, von Willebrand factor type A, EGF and pentraxin domain-containing protein 1-like [Bacillus rossius redtenbacheri]|uniref:sushi, von Willebrand factor type A, EGF and pentraxin domain-containing protein 1-like n=1 Tax=Bacillus rossius redtenbacheri TaxID=93214 RepID=UPI002FDDAC01
MSVGGEPLVEKWADMKDRRLCEDEDECGRDNGGCAGECVNTAGSFFCRCARQGADPAGCRAADLPEAWVSCPRDSRVLLPLGRGRARVRLPRPGSNVDWWRYVEAVPPWGKQLEAELPPGRHEVTFVATNPVSNSSASCSVVVLVADAERPRVLSCPQSFRVQLDPGKTSRAVTWDEPVFADNVAVLYPVYKSKSPGQQMSAGLHHVNYLAHDAAGNRATCHFSVHVKESGYRSDGVIAPRPMYLRRKVVCQGKQRIIKVTFPVVVPSGCFLRRSRHNLLAVQTFGGARSDLHTTTGRRARHKPWGTRRTHGSPGVPPCCV